MRIPPRFYTVHCVALEIRVKARIPKAKAIILGVLASNGETVVSIYVMKIHSVNIIAELMRHEMEFCFAWPPKGST